MLKYPKMVMEVHAKKETTKGYLSNGSMQPEQLNSSQFTKLCFLKVYIFHTSLKNIFSSVTPPFSLLSHIPPHHTF